MILVHRRRAQGSQADLQQQTETQQGQVLPVVSSSATFSNLPLTPEEYAGSSIGQARTYTIAVKTFSGGSPTDTSFDVSDSDSGSLTTSFGIAASSLGAGWYNLGTVTIAATDASASLTFSASGSAGLRSTDVEICLLQTDASETYTDTGLAASETDADKQTTNLGYDVIGEETSVSAPPPDADYSSVRPVTSDVYNADDETTAQTDPAGRTTAFVYSLNTTEHTDTTTTYTGQTLPVVSEAATFANLPEAAGTSDTETYTILVYSTTAVTSASGYSVTDEDSTSLTISSDVGGDTPLGANWYELGTVALPAGKSTIHISTPSGSGVTKAAVLFKSSVDTDDADGNLLTELDAAGDTSTLEYNHLNQPAQQTNPENDAPLGPVFDKAGLVASDTDLVHGAITTYEHDFLGDVTETDQPNPTAGDDDPGPVTLDAYNIDGELVSESDPQTSTVSDVSSQATDAFGNTVSTSLPDPSTGAAGGPTTTDIYDLDHEMVQEVDPMDNVTAWGFSYFGDEIGQSLPDPTTAGVADVTTAYTVDADHDTLSETDPDSNVTSWAYNNDGEEAAETTTVPAGTPDSTTISGDIAKATETFARDLDGNLTTLVDFDDRTTDYSYNLFNQEAEEQWVSGGGVTNTIAYAYNVLDQNTAGDDTYASGSPYVNTSVAIAYDLAGSVSGESQGMAGLSTVVLSSAYDYNGDRTGLSADIGGTMNADGTASGGTTVVQNTYGYDFLQEMTGIAQVSGNGDTDDSDAYSGGGAAKYVAIGYDFGGEMTSVDTYMAASADDADSGNQVMSEALSYNGDSQATDIGFTSATTGDMLAGYHYAYNNDQAVTDLYSYSDTNTSVSTPNPSEPTTTWAHAGYSYDHQQQLTATSYTYWANPPTTDGSLAYDANGNRDNTGETVSPGNQVTYDGTYYYLYDAEGNRTFKFKSTSGALDDTATDITKYTWDYRNRMTSISYYATWSHYTSNTPDTKAVYEYDAYDRQVDEDQTAGGSLDERFIWDGSSLLMTLDGSNHVSQRYLNGPAVDQVFAEEYEGGSNPGVNWLLADGQGSVRDVVRATVSDGSVVSVEAVDHVFLDAYGLQYSPQSNSDAQEQTSVGFTGLRYDTLSGFYMSATREYDPATATWIRRDPLGLAPGANPYEYCGNSPTNFIDPSGMDDYGCLTLSTATSYGGIAAPQFPTYSPGPIDRGIISYGRSREQGGGVLWSSYVGCGIFLGDIVGVTNVYIAATGGDPVTLEQYSLGGRILAGTVGAGQLVLTGFSIECVGSMAVSLCFVAGTPVATARGCTPIEAIQVDDEVLAYDLVAGRWRPCRVRKTFEHEYDGALVAVRLSGDTIESTPSHPYWVIRGEDLIGRPVSEHTEDRPTGASTDGRWVDAGYLREGDELLSRDGRILPVEAIDHRQFSGKVYNISVADLECYAVGRNSVLVHNKAAEVIPVEVELNLGPIEEGEVTTFQDFVDRSVVGDDLEGHELWQHANLKAKGLATTRLSTPASQSNPVIALERGIHQEVNAAQRSINAASQTPLQNINANAQVLRDLNVAPDETIQLLQDMATQHAQSLGF